MKTLVLYYTRSENTQYVAELIAKELKADLEEIIDLKDRSGGWGYFISMIDTILGRVTEIEPVAKNLKDYDLIVIGQPVWGGKPVPAIRSFAKRYRLPGQNLALFCSMGGTGADNLFKGTRALFLASKIMLSKAFPKPLENKEKTHREVRKFCEHLMA